MLFASNRVATATSKTESNSSPAQMDLESGKSPIEKDDKETMTEMVDSPPTESSVRLRDGVQRRLSQRHIQMCVQLYMLLFSLCLTIATTALFFKPTRTYSYLYRIAVSWTPDSKCYIHSTLTDCGNHWNWTVPGVRWRLA